MLAVEDADDCPSCPICIIVYHHCRACLDAHLDAYLHVSSIAGLQSFDPLDKAVISSCLHAFCIGCLQAWCRRSVQRLCPLCKGRIRGYLYNIRSDDDYEEHVLDDSHELEQQLQWQEVGRTQLPDHVHHQQDNSHSERHEQDERQQQRLRLQGTSPQALSGRDSVNSRRPPVQLRSEGGYTWGNPSEWRRDVRRSGSSSRSSSRWQPTTSDNMRQQLQQSSHRSSLGAAGGQQASEEGVAPRPYYWRVQQRMLASVTRLSSSGGSSSLDGTAVEARRNVYRHNVWALPHHSVSTAAAAAAATAGDSEGTCGASSHHSVSTAAAACSSRSGIHTAAGSCSSSSSSGNGLRVSEASLEVWMTRELQALLMEDDVTIVCAFVKGLVNSFGVAVPHTDSMGQQQQQQQQMLSSMRNAASQAAAGFSSTSTATAAAVDVAGSGRSHATISSAVAALEAFLFDAAAHFWHELCCYATSGLTVAAWDRAARYVPRAHALSQQGRQQQQQQVAAASQALLLSEHGQQQQQQHVTIASGAGTTAPPSSAVAAASPSASVVVADAGAVSEASRGTQLAVVCAPHANAPGAPDTAAAEAPPTAEAPVVHVTTTLAAAAAASTLKQTFPARVHAAAAPASIPSSRQKQRRSNTGKKKRSRSRSKSRTHEAGRGGADGMSSQRESAQDGNRDVNKRRRSSSRQRGCSSSSSRQHRDYVQPLSSGRRWKYGSRHEEQQEQQQQRWCSSNRSGGYVAGSALQQQQPGFRGYAMADWGAADGGRGGRWGDGTSDSEIVLDLETDRYQNGYQNHHQQQQAVSLTDRWQMD